MFEDSTKFKLPRTDNLDDTAKLQTNITEVSDNTKPMLDSICDDEDANNSTSKICMIDVNDILEMMDTQDPDPMSNTEEEKNTEENMQILVPSMEFYHCALEDKSPHHQCSYSDCQVIGSIFL